MVNYATQGHCGSGAGDVRFSFYVDQALVLQSPVLNYQSAPFDVNLDLANKEKLRILIDKVSNNWCDHANILGGELVRASSSPTTIPSVPTNLLTARNAEKNIALSWTDTSDTESGFDIDRRDTNGSAGFARVGSVNENVVTSIDNPPEPASPTAPYNKITPLFFSARAKC